MLLLLFVNINEKMFINFKIKYTATKRKRVDSGDKELGNYSSSNIFFFKNSSAGNSCELNQQSYSNKELRNITIMTGTKTPKWILKESDPTLA